MRPTVTLFAGLLLTTSPALAATPDQPTVVELFQSQGCSSCPPADAVLNALADRADVLALNFAVTYWDRLGWKDSFAKPSFTQRQWDYANREGRDSVATPQMIVNGVGVLTGNRRADVDAAISRFERTATGPSIAVEGQKLVLGAARTTAPAIIWLVRYDPRTIAVPIHAGENAGRTLPHRNVVRSLVSLGVWRGSATRLDLSSLRSEFASAILLQQGAGGPIIAARKL